MLRLEAVTTCVDYGDFLRETARNNRHHFDKWIVVTRPADEETREVCRRYNLETVLTDEWERGGAGFAKARGINKGLLQLSADAWHLHLDADIVLPSNLHQLLEAAHLDEDKIYGADRALIRGWDAWQQFQKSSFTAHDYHCRINFPEFPLANRWADPHQGYVPIGFFQLFHCNATEWRGIRHRKYPERHSTAARTDVQFALQWDRRHRLCLPEVVVYHLESARNAKGANRNGRTTIRFGPAGEKAPAKLSGCKHDGKHCYPGPHPHPGHHGRFCEICRCWWEER